MAESSRAAISEAVQKTRRNQRAQQLKRVDVTLDPAHTRMFNELAAEQNGYFTKQIVQDALRLYYASEKGSLSA
jgi:hypothetical protein